MPQFLRPSSDISAGAWTTTPLFSKINETSSNDSPLITSPSGSNTTCDLGLSTASPPEAGTRTLRFRVRKGPESNNRGLNFNLKQGGTSVQSGTVQATLPTTFTTYSITVTGTITDYSDLSIELISTGTVTGAGTNRAVVEVSWVEMEIPDQEVTNPNISGDILLPAITSTGVLENDSVATYYVKNGGSNSNTGLSDEQAFATPEHAHSIAVAGDKILLKRGSKWFGFTPQKAGTSGNPIIWDAYGEGEKPIIHGLKTITGWTDIGGGFWKVTDTDILTRSKFIKIDNALSTVARSPRTNYYQSTGATGSTTGTVTDTGFLNGKDFTGGEVVFRKNNWIVDTMLITAHSGSTIDYSGGSTTNAVTGWGYAIQNHRDVCIEELDWCQEEDDIVIYFDSIDPTSVTVEVPVIEKIDFASRGYNFFNNIVFEGFNGGSDTTNENPCFLLSASQQVKFLAGCEFKNMGNTVFHFIANNNNGFELNGISAKDCLNIFLWNRHSSSTPQFEIKNSEFEDIGNVLGAGGNGPNGYSCIIFAGSSGPCTVSGNRLKNIGYNAINFGGFEYIVEKNVVENSCSQMADGGSYYTFGKSDVAKTYVTANRILRKNVAIDSPGNAYGTPLQFSSGHPTSYMSEGIYLDDDSKNITIEDNYATGCRAGLKCQNNKDHIFSGNIFHKNISIQCLFANNNNGDFDIENINFQNNILYSDAGQLVIQFESKNNDFDIFGTFNNNYYMRPANEAGIIRHWCKLSGGSFDNLLSLLQWQETDQGEGVFYDVDTVGTPTNSTISNAYYNDSMEDAVVIDIERKRMDVDGDEVTELTLDSFEAVLLLDDLGSLGSDDVNISGEIIIPAITSEAILEHEVPVYEISGDIVIPAITSEAIISFGEPVFDISGDIVIPAITSEATLEHEVPVYEISGDILIPVITSEAILSFGEPVFDISGDIVIPAITSEATLEHEVPVYEISGDILIPAITSEATLSFGEPVFDISGDILIPAITSEAVLEHAVPVYEIEGDILLPAITSEAILEHEVPVYEISGDILIPAITSEATLSFGEPVFDISGDIVIPAITSEATLEHEIPVYEISGDILIPAITSEAVLSFGEPVFDISGDILIPAITSEATLAYSPPKFLFIPVIPTGSGTVTGAGTYLEGQEVILTATPSGGYIFGYWLKGTDILSYSATYSYTVTDEDTQTIVAFFEAFSISEDFELSPGARVPLYTGLQLAVNGEYLDLPIGFETQLNRFNPLFQTEGVIRDDYTLPIPLPHSDHNARILGHPGVIENKNRFATRTDAILYYNGMPQLRGQLRIKTPVNNNVITVNFVSGISEISTDLAERPLREIMEEEVVIHATDFNREITLTYQPVISTFFGIQIMDRTFEEDTLDDLITAINAEVDFPYSASTPGTNQITISPVFNNEFLDFWINFIPGSEWRLNSDPGYTSSYISTYSTFINQYRGIAPSNKLRFPTNANMNGFFDEANNKEYPIINYLFEENISKNHVFQPAGFGTLLGTIGNPRVRNTTSLAPYVTIEYVLERIAAFYDITIKAPFLGSDSNKMIIDHPNTIDRPVRYIDTQRIILFERSFNIADLVPDIKVNEFLKALQGMGYALVYDQYSRTLEYFLRDPYVVQDTYIDFTDRFGDVIDIQNQPRKGVTFRHSEDNSDKISEIGVTAENNGKKSLIVGDGEKIIETGFAVPIVRDNSVFFPGTAGTLDEVATKDTPSSPNFPLRLAFSFESFFFYPAMLIMGDDFTLSWFGDDGLAQTTWKHWKEVENESATITLPLFLTEIEALRKPYWLDKIMVDRSKYLIRSFELVIQDNTEYFECEAILVRIPYSERDAGE
jgi:parallel beta-helix repeat protein